MLKNKIDKQKKMFKKINIRIQKLLKRTSTPEEEALKIFLLFLLIRN